MELISIGFLLGVVFSMIVMGAGVLIGSRKKDIGLDIKNNGGVWLLTKDGVQYSPDGGENWTMSMDTQGNGIIQREKKDD
ncbi:MAG: hypothetical protein IKE18_03750 [Oscillospiraceae bacterium]|nr:hypothetical protein [Oscillospiraceae bacterium]